MRGCQSMLFAGALCALAAPAAAQSSSHWFVSAGPVLNHDTTWGARTVDNTGVTVGGGVNLGSHFEVRLLADVPPETTIVSSHDVYNGIPPVGDEQIVTTIRARNLTIGALAGWHFPVAPRVDVTTGVGWSSSRRVDDASSVAVRDGLEWPLAAPRSHQRWYEAPVFAGGARVRLTPHLSLAPELRYVWYAPAENAGAMLRTSLEARWRF